VYITTDCGFEKSLVLVIIVIIVQMLVRKNLSINTKGVHAGMRDSVSYDKLENLLFKKLSKQSTLIK